MRISAAILGIALPAEILALTFLPGGLHFAGGWIFSAGFTAITFGLIFLGVGATTYRKEPLHFGVSALGIHRDVQQATPLSPAFVAWVDVASIRQGSGSNGSFVSIRTSENRTLSFLTTREGAESALREYERSRARAQAGAGEGTAPPEPIAESTSAASRNEGPARVPSVMPITDECWRPNGFRRRIILSGVVLVMIGAALLAAFIPGVASRNDGQPVVLSGVPLMIGIIFLLSAPRFPDAVAVSRAGFAVRRRGEIQTMRFEEIVAISTAGTVLECTTTRGRSIGFDSLGAREARAIQDAYREFRSEQPRTVTPLDEDGRFTWITNPSASGAAVAFWGPIALLVAAVTVVGGLILWEPQVYLGLLPLPGLAALPAAFCVLTFGPYRNAPSSVGFSSDRLRVRYPHQFYPASALVDVLWDDVSELGGRLDRLRGQPTDPSAFGAPSTRYLSFRTRDGLTYTLGPISHEIQSRIIRSAPATRVTAGAQASWL